MKPMTTDLSVTFDEIFSEGRKLAEAERNNLILKELSTKSRFVRFVYKNANKVQFSGLIIFSAIMAMLIGARNSVGDIFQAFVFLFATIGVFGGFFLVQEITRRVSKIVGVGWFWETRIRYMLKISKKKNISFKNLLLGLDASTMFLEQSRMTFFGIYAFFLSLIGLLNVILTSKEVGLKIFRFFMPPVDPFYYPHIAIVAFMGGGFLFFVKYVAPLAHRRIAKMYLDHFIPKEKDV